MGSQRSGAEPNPLLPKRKAERDSVHAFDDHYGNTMAFKFFTVPIQNSEAAEFKLNTFLRSHTALSVDRRWVDQGLSSFWALCVDYLDPSATGKDG